MHYQTVKYSSRRSRTKVRTMIPPFPDNDQWLSMYQRMLDLLLEQKSADFLASAFMVDMREAWTRAVTGWSQSPQRYAGIRQEWEQALGRFNDNSGQHGNNPQRAVRDLRELHGSLGHCLRAMVQETPDISVEDRRILLFGVRHIVNAMSPDYWPASNEEVIRTFFDTCGASMMQGFNTFQEDIHNSVIGLDVKSAGRDDYRVGETLAITPGEVVYQNRLFQLIQYYPFSQEVYATPLLIVPPWINKFYVLDLTPTDSFVQWAVKRGYTVFMISWNNPGLDEEPLGLADYLVEGCITAINKARELSTDGQVNLAGYCIGGLLAACAAAYLAGKGNNTLLTLTLINTMLDHEEPGDIGVFLSERMLSALEHRGEEQGILDGRILRQTFTMLREDRMFWPYVVNNYFLGRPPKPNPVFYWNQDATNIPLPMLIEIIRELYHGNNLVQDGGYSLAGRELELERVDCPVFILACRNDHIVPWKSAYRSTALFGGKTRFTLSDAGHVMGVINPPSRQRGGYWEQSSNDFPEDAAQWLAHAGYHNGAWWDHWYQWNAEHQGGRVRARFPGQSGVHIIEPAPGSYVMKSIN